MYTNSVADQHSVYPGGQHTLAFYTKCVMPKLVSWDELVEIEGLIVRPHVTPVWDI